MAVVAAMVRRYPPAVSSGPKMAGTAATGETHAEAWSLLQELMRGQRGRLASIAADFDLAPAQVRALGALEPGRPCPMSDLAQALRCDNSNVTGIVDRLEARGLVARRTGERDRRVKMVEVTPAGDRLRARVRERLREPPPALAGLREEDARALCDVLRRALG
jgi:MarR family transcriptional regulator, organic hydroperoxide resistance regulator